MIPYHLLVRKVGDLECRIQALEQALLGKASADQPNKARVVSKRHGTLGTVTTVQCSCGMFHEFDSLFWRYSASGQEPMIKCQCGRRIGSMSLTILEKEEAARE